MARFKATDGNAYLVEFDGLLLARIEQECDVDLADLTAGGLARIEQDVKLLVQVLLITCDGQLVVTEDEFSKSIRGDAITHAKAAVLEAAESFFPSQEWSQILSCLKNRRTSTALLNSYKSHRGAKTEEVTDDVIMGLLEALRDGQDNTDSEASDDAENASAGGLAGIQSTSA